MSDGLEAGDYAVEFQFDLPSKLPSSFYYSDPTIASQPFAATEYLVHAHLGCSQQVKTFL